MNNIILIGIIATVTVIYLVSAVMVFWHYKFTEGDGTLMSITKGVFAPFIAVGYVAANSL